MVRLGDGACRMTDLKGRRIGLSKSLNPIKVDYRRVTEERGVELMLALNGMTRDDVEIVDCPFADDWYDGPEMQGSLQRPSPAVAHARRQRTWAGGHWSRRCQGGSDRRLLRHRPARHEACGVRRAQADRESRPVSGLDAAGRWRPPPP